MKRNTCNNANGPPSRIILRYTLVKLVDRIKALVCICRDITVCEVVKNRGYESNTFVFWEPKVGMGTRFYDNSTIQMNTIGAPPPKLVMLNKA